MRRRNAAPLAAFAVLAHCVLAAAVTIDPVDFVALQAIRKSLSDLPGSTFFTGWDFTGDPCAFPGVSCIGGRVSTLALGDPRAGLPGLAGTLDAAAISRLSSLSELSLVPGRVAGPLPANLPPEIQFLALSGNLLSGSIPASFASLRRLRTLDLSFNRISGRIPPAISRIPTLITLVLSHNFISGKIPRFPSSSPLLRLDLKRNLLSGEIPDLPPAIRYLSLSSNRLSGRIDGVLPRLSRLGYLNLADNRISGEIPNQIFAFPISVLQLQRNLLSGRIEMPPGPVGIPTVDLSRNQISGGVPAGLAGARVLYLNDNRFSGELPKEFAAAMVAGRMEVLYLQRNYLTGMAGVGPAGVPASVSACVRYNCMAAPPRGAACPSRGGRSMRPPAECPHGGGVGG